MWFSKLEEFASSDVTKLTRDPRRMQGNLLNNELLPSFLPFLDVWFPRLVSFGPAHDVFRMLQFSCPGQTTPLGFVFPHWKQKLNFSKMAMRTCTVFFITQIFRIIIRLAKLTCKIFAHTPRESSLSGLNVLPKRLMTVCGCRNDYGIGVEDCFSNSSSVVRTIQWCRSFQKVYRLLDQGYASSDVRPSPNSGHRDVEEPAVNTGREPSPCPTGCLPLEHSSQTLPTEYKATPLCSTVAQPSYNLHLRWPMIWCHMLEALLMEPVQSRIRASAIYISTQQHAHLQRDRFQPRHSYFKSFIEASMLIYRDCGFAQSSMADTVADSEHDWKERRLVQTTPYCATAVMLDCRGFAIN
ncbi:hypothetical protein KCU83_g466, partial [Aureobasidium melanogenum]